jgi:hypothetical protein
LVTSCEHGAAVEPVRHPLDCLAPLEEARPAVGVTTSLRPYPAAVERLLVQLEAVFACLSDRIHVDRLALLCDFAVRPVAA